MAELRYNPTSGAAVLFNLETQAFEETPVVQNEQTGEVKAYDGARYVTVVKAREATPAGGMLRKAEIAAQGFTDRAFDYIEGLPKLVEAGMKAAGIPETGIRLDPRAAFKEFGRAISRPIQTGLERVGGMDLGSSYETPGDKIARRAGAGAADGAAFVLPAAGAARIARPWLGAPSSVTHRVATSVAAQPTTQALSGAAGGAAAEATDSELVGLGTDLLTPSAIGAAQRFVTPSPFTGAHGGPTTRPGRTDLIAAAEREGIPLTPADITGSRPMKVFEQTLGVMPWVGKRMSNVIEKKLKAYNKAVLSKAGIDAEYATPDVLEAAGKRLGREFDALELQTSATPDMKFVDDVTRVFSEYQPYMNSQVAAPFKALYDDIQNLVRPGLDTISGAEYQKIASTIRRMERGGGGDPNYKEAITGLKTALDDLAYRSSPDDVLRDAWQDLRKRNAIYNVILKSMANTTESAAQGMISPTTLANVLKSARGARAFATADDEMMDLQRLGRVFVRQNLADPSTAERLFMQRALTGGAATSTATVGAGGAAAMGVVEPATAITALALPRLAAEAYLSPAGRKYLTNTMVPNQTQISTPLARNIVGGRVRDEEFERRLQDHLQGAAPWVKFQ